MTPFAVFFMRQFFLSLNKDLEEAAMLDGATRIGVFWRIALPLVQGPIADAGNADVHRKLERIPVATARGA